MATYPTRAAGFRALLAGALTLLLCSCGRGGADAAGVGEDRPRVVVTVGMLGDAVRAVAGDRVEVVQLIGSGVDPHLYKPTRSDAARLMDADVIFSVGLMLEGKMSELLSRAASAGTGVHAVGEGVDRALLLGADGRTDPHVWMDPRVWSACVVVVRDRLIAHDPAGAPVYGANAQAYLAELDALDAYAERVLATVPEGERVLVTAHDAFAYFGRRYGFEVVGIQGLSTESEAGVRDIERMVELIVSRGVRAVFVESTVPERNIGALVGGAGARGHAVAIGGSLFSDAMGEPGSYEGTYVGMIDHNVTTIALGLGGDAPAGGMHGRLGE